MIYIFFLVVIGYSQSFIEMMIAQQLAGYLKTMNITISEQQILQSYMKASEIATKYNISITEVVGEGLAIYSTITQAEKDQLLKDIELLRDVGLDRVQLLAEYLMKNITATQDPSKVLALIHEIAENEQIDPDNDYGLADSEFFEEIFSVFSDQINQLMAWAMEHPDEIAGLAAKLESYLAPADEPVQPPAHNTTNKTEPVTPPPNQNQTVNNTANNTTNNTANKTADNTNTTEPINTNETKINTTNPEVNETVSNNTSTNKTAELDDDDAFEEEELDEDEGIVAKSNSNDSSALLVIMVLLLSLLVLIAALLIRRHINRQKLLTFKMNDELTEQGVQAF